MSVVCFPGGTAVWKWKHQRFILIWCSFKLFYIWSRRVTAQWLGEPLLVSVLFCPPPTHTDTHCPLPPALINFMYLTCTQSVLLLLVLKPASFFPSHVSLSNISLVFLYLEILMFELLIGLCFMIWICLLVGSQLCHLFLLYSNWSPV